MKRTIWLLFVFLALQGCKKNQERTAPLPLLDVTDCITLADYDTLSTNSERAEWLVSQGGLVCDSILYAREIIHEVAAADVKLPPNAKPYIMNWADFESVIGTTIYENYVGFELDSVNDVKKVLLVPAYVETGNTYSVPMFRSIGIRFKFTASSILEFFVALVKDESKIVIRFKNENGVYVYYDVTSQPV